MAGAGTIVLLIQIWLGIGLAIAAVFLVFGIDRVEPSARGTYVFRPLLVPGICLIWPLVLWRWRQLEARR